MENANLLNWIELSQSALDKNIDSLSKLAGGKLLALSVKANAYGHGIEQIVSMLKDNPQVSYLTVHSLDEAAKCRDSGWIKNILVMGPIPNDSIESVADLNLEPVVFEKGFLDKLGQFGERHNHEFKTHLKLETGTNRFGITENELPGFIDIYKKYNSLKKPYGAYTHFANIEDTTDHSYAERQLSEYKKLLNNLESNKMKPTLCHTASSAASILFSKTHFDMVRPGISLYGYWPSKETYLSYQHQGGSNDLFQPVLSWKTKVAQLKYLNADEYIGYGCSFKTTSKTKLAVLPIGYYDGYDRRLSNLAHVLINGQRAPIRGRVCMNITMADVTDITKVKTDETVTLLGQDTKESVSADLIAGWSQSINYEILSRLSGSIFRKVVK